MKLYKNIQENLSLDKFLGGKLLAYQPSKGYKSGTDAVLLASIVNEEVLNSNSSILDIGCGVGVASLCLLSRIPYITITGIEKHDLFYEIACLNKEKNNLNNFNVIKHNICDDNINTNSYNVVITNPPYFNDKNFVNEGNPLKAAGNFETDANLEKFIQYAFKSLKNYGYLYLINTSERLHETINLLSVKHWGGVEVFPIYSYQNKAASRFIVKAQKLSKSISKMQYGIVIHNNDGSYTKHATSILREGKSFYNDKEGN